MKKLSIGFLTAVLIVMTSFVACSNNAVEEKGNGVAQISFALDSANSKTLSASYPTATAKGDLYWYYAAKKLDDLGTTGKTGDGKGHTEASYATRIGTEKGSTGPVTMSYGKWEVVLYAFDSSNPDDKTNEWIYSGTAEFTITSGTVSSGSQTVSVETKATTTSSGGKKKAQLSCNSVTFAPGVSGNLSLMYQIGGTTSGKWTAIGTQGEIDATPSATVYVGVFDSEISTTDPVITESVTASFYRGHTTTITGSITDLSAGVTFDPSTSIT